MCTSGFSLLLIVISLSMSRNDNIKDGIYLETELPMRQDAPIFDFRDKDVLVVMVVSSRTHKDEDVLLGNIYFLDSG